MNDLKQESSGSKPTPNIFNYATSELSQDAFILWLLDWANPQYAEYDKALCDTAQDFVRLLLNEKDLKVTSVKCQKQEHHIDVFAIINEQYAIIVEDKTNTSEHGDQIRRYYEWVNKEKKYSDLSIHCVYYKTGNESKHNLTSLKLKYASDLQDRFFRIIGKEDVLNILQNTKSKNAIILEYIDRIKHLHELTNAFNKGSYKDWKWETWQGFYMALEDKLGKGDWGYVANPSGGFLGYWWHWCPLTIDPTIELYLQFEQDKLCIKAYSKAETRPLLSWSTQIESLAFHVPLPIFSPHKRRIGKTMTLAVVESKFLFDIPLDFDSIIEKLKAIERFVTELSKQIH